MATEKASPAENAHQADAEDAQAPESAAPSIEMARVSEDLDRIASYLHGSRSATTERASGLAAEIAQRRHEIAERIAKGSPFAEPLSEIVRELPERRRTGDYMMSAPEINPLLAERLHAFCRDMDELLDSLQSRIAHSSRIKH